jgi:hypothetical protein
MWRHVLVVLACAHSASAESRVRPTWDATAEVGITDERLHGARDVNTSSPLVGASGAAGAELDARYAVIARVRATLETGLHRYVGIAVRARVTEHMFLELGVGRIWDDHFCCDSGNPNYEGWSLAPRVGFDYGHFLTTISVSKTALITDTNYVSDPNRLDISAAVGVYWH